MPIVLTSDQRAALQSGEIAVRTLIDFYFDSGRYSFWDGAEHLDFDGTTYLVCGDFGEISAIKLGQDLGAEGIEIKLNGTKLLEGSPSAFDPGALFGTIEAENYQNKPVVISLAFFHARTFEYIMTVPRFDGLVDQIKQTEQENEAEGRFEAVMIIHAESLARRYAQRGGRTRSMADQREIWPDDTFFDMTPQVVSQRGNILWGRKAPGPTSTVLGVTGRLPNVD